ncbi:MAG: SdpI family protein [Gemmatimonadaceae bacterium]
MRKWIPLLIVVVAVGTSAALYSRLPETLATHWDSSGHPNGWSGRFFGAWLLPLFMLAMWGLIRVLPAVDPRGSNYAKFGGAFETIIVTIMLFMLALHVVVLLAALGYPVAMNRVLPFGVGILFVVIGNLLPRARPNWFIGIRTPWTLSSDRVWEKTHRFGGRLFVASGLLTLIAALVVPHWAIKVLFASITATAAGALIYSYMEWRREQAPTNPV